MKLSFQTQNYRSRRRTVVPDAELSFQTQLINGRNCCYPCVCHCHCHCDIGITGQQDGDNQPTSPPTSPPACLLREKLLPNYGCFLHQDSFLDFHILTITSLADRAKVCSSIICQTFHFGIIEFICSCFVQAPEKRLTIETCDTYCGGVAKEDLMEAYVNVNLTSEYNQDITTAVHNLWLKKTTHLWILHWKVDLYKDECGTNMYEV